MRVHRFAEPAGPNIGEAFGAPAWVGYTCLDCGKVSGLDAWQIEQMPTDMAECPKGRRLGLFERLWLRLWPSSVDCLRT